METYETGTRLGGRYVLTSRVATGATAVVWRADDELLRRPVAVKVLHAHLADDHDLADRFAGEARLAATVSHPALVGVYDTIVGPPPAIVLELVDGPDMRQRLDHGACSIAEVLGLGATIADALDVAHRAGLVHRDVKPANIICTSAGHPKLGDFGIATAGAGDRTATGMVLGTAKYLAPEQVRGGRIDPRTDVYALCIVLYEALCGRVPFERPGDLPTAMARLEDTPALPRSIRPDIPTGLESIIMRGLARDADSRWPSTGALRDALQIEADMHNIEIGPIDVHDVGGGANRPAPATRPASAPDTPTGDPTRIQDRTRPLRDVEPESSSAPPTRRRWVRRSLVAAGFAAIALLGASLVGDNNPISDLTHRLPAAATEPVPASITTFDPEGSGPSGEHDDLAANVLDGDPGTSWYTERYDDRDMGAKAGVGLVIELTEPTTVSELNIDTDGVSWAIAVYVADVPATTLAGWGPAASIADGLDAVATLRIDTRGAAVLVWLTDLGSIGPPYRLTVHDVTIS